MLLVKGILSVCFLLALITAGLGDLDVVFLMDNSGSVEPGYATLKAFVAGLIDSLPKLGTRVGLVRFSHMSEVDFYLNTYADLVDASHAVVNAPFRYLETNTSGALATARTEMFTIINGDRPSVPNVAILITDGPSNLEEHRTLPEANLLHMAGVHVFAIGVTDAANNTEVRRISSPPHGFNQDYFLVSKFSHLWNVKETLLNQLSALSPTVVPSTTVLTSTTTFLTPSTTFVTPERHTAILPVAIAVPVVLFAVLLGFVIVGLWFLRKRAKTRASPTVEVSPGHVAAPQGEGATRDTALTYQQLDHRPWTFERWVTVNKIPDRIIKKLKKQNIGSIVDVQRLSEKNINDLQLTIGDENCLKAAIHHIHAL